MTTIEEFVTFSGDAERAFDTALRALLPLGFQVEERGASRLVVRGPGYDSSRQDALLGISRAVFTAAGSTLEVHAELEGVDRLMRRLLFLILGLAFFDLALFTALWYFLEPLRRNTWILATPALALLPWVFLAPYLTRLFSGRTRQALAALLENIALLS